MPISKIGQRRQVVIPKDICDELGLAVGDFVEVNRVNNTVVIKRKKLVDADDELTPDLLSRALEWSARRPPGAPRLDALEWPEIARQTLSVYRAGSR